MPWALLVTVAWSAEPALVHSGVDGDVASARWSDGVSCGTTWVSRVSQARLREALGVAAGTPARVEEGVLSWSRPDGQKALGGVAPASLRLRIAWCSGPSTSRVRARLLATLRDGPEGWDLPETLQLPGLDHAVPVPRGCVGSKTDERTATVTCVDEIRTYTCPAPPDPREHRRAATPDDDATDEQTTSIGTILTKEFLQRVPTGRSYQEDPIYLPRDCDIPWARGYTCTHEGVSAGVTRELGGGCRVTCGSGGPTWDAAGHQRVPCEDLVAR